MKTFKITIIVRSMKYIKEHSTIFNTNIYHNNKLHFNIVSENNTYFAYLNFIIICSQFILDSKANIYIYIAKKSILAN